MTRERCGLNHSWACLFLSSFVFVVSVIIVPWLFFFRCTHTALAQGPTKSSGSKSSHIARACVVSLWVLFLISSTSPFTSSLSSSSLWSPCCSYCPTPSTSRMWWTNTLHTSAEDLGTLAENNASTGHEPNDHFITEAFVEYTQESSSEQRFPDDFDYGNVTIGKTLSDACRRRADHSEGEGLSSCLSSSVSHDRTVRPVVCSLVSSAQESQRHTSESEQIRTLLERQREQILADRQAEIQKTRIPGRLRQKKYFKAEWNDRVAERRHVSRSSRRRTTSTRLSTFSWTVIEAKLESSWSSWEKPQCNETIEAISRLNIRDNYE